MYMPDEKKKKFKYKYKHVVVVVRRARDGIIVKKSTPQPLSRASLLRQSFDSSDPSPYPAPLPPPLPEEKEKIKVPAQLSVQVLLPPYHFFRDFFYRRPQ